MEGKWKETLFAISSDANEKKYLLLKANNLNFLMIRCRDSSNFLNIILKTLRFNICTLSSSELIDKREDISKK